MTFCLDAWAVVAWLQGAEPGATRVDELLADRPVMSWINLGEVYYVVHRRMGRAKADSVTDSLRARVSLDLPDARRILEAATIKASYPLPYADAFAVATALAHKAVLVTGDPEIIAGNPAWQIEDIR